MDPQLGISLLLKKFWNENSDLTAYVLDKGDVKFRTSPVDETIDSPQVTVTRPTPEDRLYARATMLSKVIPLTLGEWQHNIHLKPFLIRVRIKILGSGEENKGQSKQKRYLMEEEVDRIFRKYPTSVTDVDKVFLDGGFTEDVTQSADSLSSCILIIAKYQRTS